MKELYTTGEVARICEVSKRTVINWFESGRIEGFKMPSGVRRIPREALLRFLANNNYPVDNLQLTKHKILIFADQFDKAAVISKYLNERARFNIRMATQPPHLYALVEDFSPQVIIMDTPEPEELCARLPSHKHLRIIGLLATSNPKSSRRTFDATLTKPLSKKELFEVLQKYLGLQVPAATAKRGKVTV